MSTCPRCGSPYHPQHKFCGTCASPLPQAGPAPAPQAAAPMAAAPQQQGGFGPPPQPPGPPQARCQLGHEIAQGFTYCAHGHPIALEAMQLAGGDAFGGHAPPPQPPYAPPPHQGPPPNAPYEAPPAMHAYPSPAQPPVAPSPPSPPAGPSPHSLPETAPRVPGLRRQLMGFLVSFHNDPLGAFYPLYAGINRVGRAGAAEGLDVEIADPATSSMHAQLHLDPASLRAVLEDLGSTNGSFANDERLAPSGHRDLRNGDRVRFGSYTATLLLLPQR